MLEHKLCERVKVRQHIHVIPRNSHKMLETYLLLAHDGFVLFLEGT